MPTPRDYTYGPYGGRTKRGFYEGLLGAMKSERSSFDAQWQEIADYIAPARVRFTASDRNQAIKRRSKIIDSTASFALRTLQSGMHAGLTSPARPWFKLTTPDPDLAEHGPVKDWLHIVTQRMLLLFQKSNLYNSLPIVYGDLGGFGTAAMSVVPDVRALFRTYAYPLGSYVLGQDSRGRVSTFIREYELTVRQLIEQFGGEDGRPIKHGEQIDWDRFSQAVKAMWDNSQYESPVQVVWAVAPNPEAREGAINAKYFKYVSCYFERSRDEADRSKMLRESGFKSFPILAPRWDIIGEDSYGQECPGMIAIGDVKQVQSMERKKAQALAKIVDPPLVGPAALRTQKTSLLAGDVTYVDQREGQSGLRPIHEIGLNIEHLMNDEERVTRRVQRAFYEDLFLMLAQSDAYRGAQPVTAREVEERHEEKLLALGPVIARTDDELLDPLIDRVFDMMEEEGLMPDAPEELHGIELGVEYISILNQAQKLVGVVGQDRFLQTMVPLAQEFPQVRAKIDINRLVNNYGEMLGIDPRVIVSDEAADAAVAAQQKAQQAAQSAAVAKDTATAAKTTSEIPIGQGNTMLDRVLSGVGA